MDYTLNNNLKNWVSQNETLNFVQNNPILVPHRYTHKNDIEVSAFFTAWLYFGNEKLTIAKAKYIDDNIFNNHPYNYVNTKNPEGKFEWEKYEKDNTILHKSLRYRDFYTACKKLNNFYVKYGSLEETLKEQKNEKLHFNFLVDLFGNVSGIVTFNIITGFFRVLTFLRWMCRKNSPVDFGIWDNDIVNPANLIMPINKKILNAAYGLGLTTRQDISLNTAIEITDRFCEIFPDDPTKGYFALYNYSPRKLKNKKNMQKKGVAELSVNDVLDMEIFKQNLRAEIERLWEIREHERVRNRRKGIKLKSHCIDKLYSSGQLTVINATRLFRDVLNKTCSLSRDERNFINDLGLIVFKKTMQKLIDDEKKGVKDDGPNR